MLTPHQDPHKLLTLEPQGEDSPIPKALFSLPPVPSKHHVPLLILGILGVFLIGSVVAFYLLSKNQSNNLQTSTRIPNPTLQPSEAMAEEASTADWQTYNSKMGFLIKLPSSWLVLEDHPTRARVFADQKDTVPGNLYNLEILAAEWDMRFMRTSDPIGVKKMIAEGVTKEKVANLTIDSHELSKSIISVADDSGTDLTPRTVLDFELNEKYITISFIPHSNTNLDPVFDQILSTFKFIETNTDAVTPKAPAKVLNYVLPSSWLTTKSNAGNLEMGYDPDKAEPCTHELPDNNIGLCAKTSYGTGSFIGASIRPYDGGSRHEFIYDQAGGGKPQQQDYWDDYSETEYNWNGKSCLFLNGITVSQSPTVWGMCALSSNSALFFTSYNRDESTYVQYLQTIKVLN